MITDVLLQAYTNTDYVVCMGCQHYIIKIGRCVPDEVAGQSGQGMAIVTACNPYSRKGSEEDNNRRQRILRDELNTYAVYPAEGISKDKLWREPSFLVLDIRRDDARKLGMRFQQNAVVFARKSEPAELLFCVTASL